MRRITFNKKILPAVVLATLLCCGLIFTGCSTPEDDRNTYTVTFVASYTVKEKKQWVVQGELLLVNGERVFETVPLLDHDGNVVYEGGEPIQVEKPKYKDGTGTTVEVEVWKIVEPEYLKDKAQNPIETNTLGRLSRLPGDPQRPGYYFDGWFTSGGVKVSAVTVFTADSFVFAKWKIDETIVPIEPGPVAKEFARIRAELASGTPNSNGYTVTVDEDEIILPQTLFYDGPGEVRITLIGRAVPAGEPQPTLTLTDMGNLIEVGKNITLELRNIWLQGGERNTMALVGVNGGGKLIIGQTVGDGDKTKIFNNRSEDPRAGGGVTVNEGGDLVMNSGEISGNSSSNTTTTSGITGGGGVLVRSGGVFTLNGGKIQSNGAPNGGGVMVYGGKFYMKGGEIYDNVGPTGGGVVVYRGGWFEMEAGTIHYNKANNGAGVLISRGAEGTMPYDPRKPDNPPAPGGLVGIDNTKPINDPARKEGFYMKGGLITKNGAAGAGGGIANDQGAFTYMTGGTVSENTGRDVAGVINLGLFIMDDTGSSEEAVITGNRGGFGGGVDAYAGRFILISGKITGNIASGSGAGVIVGDQFIMHGGEITDNEAEQMGGGVFLRPSGFFSMSGGTIDGNKAAKANTGTIYFDVTSTLNPDLIGTAFYGKRAGDLVDPHGYWGKGENDGPDKIVDPETDVFIVTSFLSAYPYNNTRIEVITDSNPKGPHLYVNDTKVTRPNIDEEEE